MPLASRATQNRAERVQKAADPASAPSADEATQPRRKPGTAAVVPDVATTPTAVQTAPDAADTAGGGDTAPAAAKAPRKARTPRTAAPSGLNAEPVDPNAPRDVKALRTRQREIEKEFKNLNKEQAQALRDVAGTFRERRQKLESEHRLIANQLSSVVFSG